MAGKLLSRVGIAALLGVGAAGVAALVVVKQRITLVVAEQAEHSTRGPDPIDLLRADVAGLREDLGALSQALGPQLGRLHEALEAAANERAQAEQATLERTRAELERLAARVETLDASVARVQRDLALSLARVERSVAPLQESSSSEALARAVEPILVDVSLGDALAAPSTAPSTASSADVAPEPPPRSPAAPPEPKRKFLSFSLPSQSFAFEGRQRLALVPSLSRVGFDAKSTLHDFSGVTQKIEGELEVDLAQPDLGVVGTVRVDARSLDTGMADRDENMRAHLDVAAHPELRFAWTGLKHARVDARAQTVEGVACGKLSIRGVERDVTLPVRVSVDASKRVAIEGELEIAMKDWGVEPPSQLGVIRVENKIKVWLALRARSLGPAPANSEGAATAPGASRDP